MFASSLFRKIPCPHQPGACESVFCPFDHTSSNKRSFPIEPAPKEQPETKKVKKVNKSIETSIPTPPTTKPSLDAKTSLAQVSFYLF
jgi:hypothetical protein